MRCWLRPDRPSTATPKAISHANDRLTPIRYDGDARVPPYSNETPVITDQFPCTSRLAILESLEISLSPRKGYMYAT